MPTPQPRRCVTRPTSWELGADTETIRVQLFESKSCGRIAVEAEALSHVRYYAGGRIAVIAVTTEMVERAGVDESELEGLASKPLTIIGVDIGITLKERADGSIPGFDALERSGGRLSGLPAV